MLYFFAFIDIEVLVVEVLEVSVAILRFEVLNDKLLLELVLFVLFKLILDFVREGGWIVGGIAFCSKVCILLVYNIGNNFM